MLQTYVTSGSSLSHGQQARNTSAADDIEVEFPASVWNLKYNHLVVIYVKQSAMPDYPCAKLERNIMQVFVTK